jgi:hypothetical protein
MGREDEIKQIAYCIWEQEGCCHGHDIEHWVRAEIVWREKQKTAEVKPVEQPAAVPGPAAGKKSEKAQTPEKAANASRPAAGKKTAHKRQR